MRPILLLLCAASLTCAELETLTMTDGRVLVGEVTPKGLHGAKVALLKPKGAVIEISLDDVKRRDAFVEPAVVLEPEKPATKATPRPLSERLKEAQERLDRAKWAQSNDRATVGRSLDPRDARKDDAHAEKFDSEVAAAQVAYDKVKAEALSQAVPMDQAGGRRSKMDDINKRIADLEAKRDAIDSQIKAANDEKIRVRLALDEEFVMTGDLATVPVVLPAGASQDEEKRAGRAMTLNQTLKELQKNREERTGSGHGGISGWLLTPAFWQLYAEFKHVPAPY